MRCATMGGATYGHDSQRVILSLHFFFLFSSSLTDQGYRWLLSAIRSRVADVTGFIVIMIYWFLVCDHRHGEKNTHTKKNKSIQAGRQAGRRWLLLNAKPLNMFHPVSPGRRVIFLCVFFFSPLSSLLSPLSSVPASGYCLAICLVALTRSVCPLQHPESQRLWSPSPGQAWRCWMLDGGWRRRMSATTPKTRLKLLWSGFRRFFLPPPLLSG